MTWLYGTVATMYENHLVKGATDVYDQTPQLEDKPQGLSIISKRVYRLAEIRLHDCKMLCGSQATTKKVTARSESAKRI